MWSSLFLNMSSQINLADGNSP
jgi:hypothetical protein